MSPALRDRLRLDVYIIGWADRQKGFVTCMQADVATNGCVQPVDEVRLEVSLLPCRRGLIRVLAENSSSSAGNDEKSWINHYVRFLKYL